MSEPRRKPTEGKMPENDRRQSDRFVESARELGADQSEEEFDEALRRIAKAPVRERKPSLRAPHRKKGES